MRTLTALMLMTTALAGCFGGDDVAEPVTRDRSGRMGTLPQGLEMAEADVIAYGATNVVWRWADTAGPGVGGTPSGRATTATTFDVPAGVDFAIEANLTWTNDDVTDLNVHILDMEGNTVCQGVPPGSVVYPSPAPAAACAGRVDRVDGKEEWTVQAETYASRQTQTPFVVHLRLEALRSDGPKEVGDVRTFEATADDGTSLRGHLYLPEAEPPFATILELSGYWNTAFGLAQGRTATNEMTVEERGRTTLRGHLGWFLESGFAVALVNIRGTGISGGCQDYAGERDVADAGRVIEALAQHPWSDGNVGMVGGSWPGTSVYTGIASGATPLKAAGLYSATIDWWHDETQNGAPSGTPGQTAVYTALGSGPMPVPDARHNTCPDHPDDLVENLRYLENGDRTPWFAERDLRRGLENTSAAVFAAYGLANAEWVPLRDHGFWDRIPHDNKSLLLGQWRHNPPARADWWPDVVAWFDHHLRDGPAPDFAGQVRHQDAAGTWHQAHRWPPDGEEVRLHLSNGGLTEAQDEVVRSEVDLASSGRRALPDTCRDHALFVSPPLAEDIVVAGVFHANLTLSSTLPDGNFATNLWHVDEPWACGTAPGTQGTTSGTGTITAPNPGQERFEVGRAMSDLYHRGHLHVGRDYPIGSPDVMRMTSESFATHIPAGERLVLAIGGGDPQLIDDPRRPVLTVHTGPELEGTLTLTVIEGDLTFLDPDQEAQKALVEVEE